MPDVPHDPMLPGHYVKHRWMALCSCGWVGPERDTDVETRDDLRKHHEALGIGTKKWGYLDEDGQLVEEW